MKTALWSVTKNERICSRLLAWLEAERETIMGDLADEEILRKMGC